VTQTRSILAQPQRSLLAAFTNGPVLLAFDYDGVLAPIASAPDKAHMRPRTRRLLVELAARYPCAVISGRSLRDLEARLAGVPLQAISGNYGREPHVPGVRPSPHVRVWLRVLTDALAPLSGVVVENKRYSITVHYRHARRRAEAVDAIRAAVASLRHVRVVESIEAVALIPWPGATKGTALQHARRAAHCEKAIYAGDDGTDEDAFASASSEHLLSIKVGHAPGTRAAYHLDRQADVDTLFERLISLRNPRQRLTSTP
jgi:trehalose 6-phosphate phosphatase